MKGKNKRKTAMIILKNKSDRIFNFSECPKMVIMEFCESKGTDHKNREGGGGGEGGAGEPKGREGVPALD